jgi:putative phosphoribosyl transferase
MRFEDRLEAGRILAAELRRLELGPCVVAGIPRGGVAVAAPIAEALGAPLVAVHTRKLSLPREPELAFGAMDEDGHTVLDYRATVTLGLGESDVEEIKSDVAREMAWRVASYPGPRLADFLPGRTVVLVDDGLATGLTMQAAIAYAHRQGATAIVAAVPCASDRAAYEVGSLLSRSDDRLACLLVDPAFRGVGDYYQDFRPPSDQEVAGLLGTTPRRFVDGPSPGPRRATDTP